MMPPTLRALLHQGSRKLYWNNQGQLGNRLKSRGPTVRRSSHRFAARSFASEILRAPPSSSRPKSKSDFNPEHEPNRAILEADEVFSSDKPRRRAQLSCSLQLKCGQWYLHSLSRQTVRKRC